MRAESLAGAIRDAFNSRHEVSPGLEVRVLGAIPWDRPAERSPFRPRLAGAFAVVLACALVIALAAPAVLSKLGVFQPAAGGQYAPAYSLAAVSGQTMFIVQRTASNVLLESSDGGWTWTRRLKFDGIYGGMQMFGKHGYVWSIDMSGPICHTNCTPPPNTLWLYATSDGGASWVKRPSPAFHAEDAFFLDGTTGWAVAYAGLTGETLYATADEGRTWTHVGDLPRSQPMSTVFGVGAYRVTFTDSSTGWYVGSGQLFSTRDAGLSWQSVVLAAPAAVAGWTVAPTQPEFSGRHGTLAIGYRNPGGADNATPTHVYFYASNDGGQTWTDARPAPSSTSPVGDDFVPTYLDADHAWLTSLSLSGGDNAQAAAAVARSSDGGLTWTVASRTPRILSMAFIDKDHGYGLDVSGPMNVNGIVTTSDGGATWRRVVVPVF
jgi:hypothetical protein